MALVTGQSKYGLECLKNVDKAASLKAKEIQNQNIIDIEVKDDEKEIYIDIIAISKDKESRVIIKDSHTNIVFESLNDKVLLNKDSLRSDGNIESPSKRILDY